MNTKIKEIFQSIQGEGILVGYKQLFIRFCACNLSCQYCDTNFLPEEKDSVFSAEELATLVNRCENIHSVSLTGGEPLLFVDFLKEFLPLSKQKIYLETNATLPENLEKVIDYVDYVAADIKIPSVTKCKPYWDIHDKFFEIANQKQLFAKLIFDNNITDEEIINSVELCKKYDIELILQPKMVLNKPAVKNKDLMHIFDKFDYKKVRLIPQTHKFLDIE